MTRKADLPETSPILDIETARLKRAVADKKKLLKELRELQEAEDELIGGAPEQLRAPEAIPGEGKVADILANLTGQGSFDIVKIAAGGVQENVGRYDVDAWPEGFNLTLKEHGSGDYLLLFRDKDGKHAGRVMRTYRVPGGAAPAAAAASGSSDLLAFLKIQADKDAAHERSMSELRLEMAKQSAESTKMVIEAMKAQSSGGLFKNAQDIAVIAKLFKDDKPNALEQLMDAKEFLEDLKGSARGEAAAEDSPLIALLAPVIAAILPKLPTAIARRPAPAHAPVAPIERGPAPGPAAIAPAAPAPVPETAAAVVEPVVISLADYVQSFKEAIGGGIDPVNAADFAWEAAQKQGKENAFASLLEGADWTTLDADEYLKQHGEWLRKFRVRAEELAFARD